MSGWLVDLNVDLGELPDEPRELYGAATVANIACGGHAGDAKSMARAVSFALARGARVAAHPSYPDRAGFGRASMAMAMPADEIRASVAAQCASLQAIAARLGFPARILKPHGALYHDAHKDPAIARAVIAGGLEGLGAGELVVVGLAGGALEAEARARGLAFAREGFADRAYAADGSLVPRSQPGALITDTKVCARQAIALASTGRVETVCVHGDGPAAVDVAQAVHDALAGAGMLIGAA